MRHKPQLTLITNSTKDHLCLCQRRMSGWGAVPWGPKNVLAACCLHCWAGKGVLFNNAI